MPDFDVADRLLPLHELGHGGREMLALLRGHGFHRGLPKCLLRRVAKQLLHLRGGVRNAPRGIALDEPIPHALDDGAEALLALAKQLLRLPVLGNVLLNTVPEHTAVGAVRGAEMKRRQRTSPEGRRTLTSISSFCLFAKDRDSASARRLRSSSTICS